jgi:hypothetical protein
MVRLANRTGGVAAALMGVCGLLASCNSKPVDTSSAHIRAIHAVVAADHVPGHIDVSDNFDAADLEQRFEEVARNAAPAVVAISATDAKVDADEALLSSILTATS